MSFFRTIKLSIDSINEIAQKNIKSLKYWTWTHFIIIYICYK